MAVGGPTVTLTFKGDTDQLQREIAGIGTMVAGVGATVGILGAVGAAAGAVVLSVAAVPAAFLGIGIAAAAQSEVVKARFTELKDHVVASVTAMSKPIEAELLRSANSIQAAYDRIAPSLGRIFELATPHLRIFTDGVIALVENAMPGLETAVRNSTPLVEAFGRGLGTLGTGIGGFFAALSEGSPGATVAMDALFGLVKDLLIYLGQLVAQLANALGPAFAAMTGPVMDVVRALGDALMPIVKALAPLISAVATTMRDILVPVLGALGPPIAAVVTALSEQLQPILVSISEWFGRNSEKINEIAGLLGTYLAEVVRTVGPLLGELVTVALRLAEALLPIIPPLIEVARNLLPALNGVLRDLVIPALQWLVDMLVKYVIPQIQAWVDQMATASRALRTAWGDIKLVTQQGVDGVTDVSGAGGRSMMQAFLDGVVTMTGPTSLGIKTALDAVRGLFPGSPAVWGPFSGRGYTLYSGQAMIEDFGRGIIEAAPRLAELARGALEGARVALSPGFGTGAGGTLSGSAPGLGTIDLRVAPGVDSALSSLLMNLVRTGQLQLQRAG